MDTAFIKDLENLPSPPKNKKKTKKKTKQNRKSTLTHEFQKILLLDDNSIKSLTVASSNFIMIVFTSMIINYFRWLYSHSSTTLFCSCTHKKEIILCMNKEHNSLRFRYIFCTRRLINRQGIWREDNWLWPDTDNVISSWRENIFLFFIRCSMILARW